MNDGSVLLCCAARTFNPASLSGDARGARPGGTAHREGSERAPGTRTALRVRTLRAVHAPGPDSHTEGPGIFTDRCRVPPLLGRGDTCDADVPRGSEGPRPPTRARGGILGYQVRGFAPGGKTQGAPDAEGGDGHTAMPCVSGGEGNVWRTVGAATLPPRASRRCISRRSAANTGHGAQVILGGGAGTP